MERPVSAGQPARTSRALALALLLLPCPVRGQGEPAVVDERHRPPAIDERSGYVIDHAASGAAGRSGFSTTPAACSSVW